MEFSETLDSNSALEALDLFKKIYEKWLEDDDITILRVYRVSYSAAPQMDLSGMIGD